MRFVGLISKSLYTEYICLTRLTRNISSSESLSLKWWVVVGNHLLDDLWLKFVRLMLLRKNCNKSRLLRLRICSYLVYTWFVYIYVGVYQWSVLSTISSKCQWLSMWRSILRKLGRLLVSQLGLCDTFFWPALQFESFTFWESHQFDEKVCLTLRIDGTIMARNWYRHTSSNRPRFRRACLSAKVLAINGNSDHYFWNGLTRLENWLTATR